MEKDLVLTVEQSLRLQELGLDTGGAVYGWHNKMSGYRLYPMRKDRTGVVPTLTLQEIWNILPKEISKGGRDYTLELFEHDSLECFKYVDRVEKDTLISTESGSVLEAAYLMLCEVLENGYFKK